jgi:hypothetical protein
MDAIQSDKREEEDEYAGPQQPLSERTEHEDSAKEDDAATIKREREEEIEQPQRKRRKSKCRIPTD